MKAVYLAIAGAVFVVLAGCSATPSRDFQNFAITISGDGDILAPNPSGQDFVTIGSVQGSKEYIEGLFRHPDQKGDDLLIFMHGGLNNRRDSTNRVNKLIEMYNQHELDSRYPILVNWDSGFLRSYFEHLFEIRQGEAHPLVAVPTSPFYFLADLGRGIVRAPVDIGYVAVRDVQSIPNVDKVINRYRANTNLLYEEIRNSSEDYAHNVYLGAESGWDWGSAVRIPVNLITFIPQLLFSPLVDGIGTPSWESMQRRTKVLYNKPEQFDIKRKQHRAKEALRGQPVSVMTLFADRLQRYTTEHPKARVTIIGHSMGTFIINELIRKYPEIRYQNIVYMAGADSIRNTFNSINPYLAMHSDARFFNLTLHPQSEIQEPNYYLLPRGSLLIWIDDFYSMPHTQLDRTVGRWENLIQAYGEIPVAVRKQVYIKAFAENSPVNEHGEFGNARFWEESFWSTGTKDAPPSETIRKYFAN